ncbi:mitochondrial carrier protein [Trypanosoma theileri]|uniref:Mitochondrial carrier protein n=1 Tax=Trypanosoma theileri TaxID=67003 RepID=A0A1X0NUT2_9TRYP|nr:mitochondrial carrier protein [Trypanosoma theileri]ORC88308.1 mitochondrial carrier protein [Trypanosoma theileri]
MTDFIAGWMGGLSVLLVGHPFDTIKVWQQSINAGSVSGSSSLVRNNSIKAAMEMYRAEGIGAFYKGICAPMCAVGLANGALFGTYSSIVNIMIRNGSSSYYYNDDHHILVKYSQTHDHSITDSEKKYHRRNSMGNSSDGYQKQDLSEHLRTGGQLTAFENFIASTGAGIAYATIMNPFEVVKIRRQTERLFPHRRYLGTVHCARQLYAKGGIKSFFKGYTATLIRDIPGTGVYLYSYSTFIRLFGGEKKNPNVPRILLAGGCAGVTQWILIFPLDTIKTKIQISKEGEYVGWTRCARKLYNHRGFIGLYRGVAPALVRAFAANGAAFVGVEATLEFFRSAGMEDGDVWQS